MTLYDLYVDMMLYYSAAQWNNGEIPLELTLYSDIL